MEVNNLVDWEKNMFLQFGLVHYLLYWHKQKGVKAY
jgi:hypothetical protein